MDGSQIGLFDAQADEEITLARYAEQAYLDYAISVVRGRALPEVTDGQKPVQRRILYAMQAMGLAAGARPVKSARVVGDVLGKYHPHGDQAAYDALVRMAQDFVLRYPLIDGQGNFGSRDGDNAAAMRYTEARLTPFARVLLDELNEGTVDFTTNYDGSQQEPIMLPARLPVMLLNGASGIAVGMATEIPSHNLREITQACIDLLRRPRLSDEALFATVPGPDFAGGGQIISPAEDIATLYTKGRGTLKARARWHFEELARGQWQWVITELPPGVSSQRILEEIEGATNPRPRGNRKTLTQSQQQNRALLLDLLDTVRDEAGKEAAVRLVFEPRSSRIDRDEFVNTLLAQTSLEANVSINLVCLGLDGRPRQRSLREILTQWLEFRNTTVRRRTEFRLQRVTERIHVLEGRMVVYLNVDEVIQTIREAEAPRQALMERFKLTERQAEDILEMRLRQLARLEGIKIEQELSRQQEEAAHLQELLDNPDAFKRLIIRELKADMKTYGDDRRTLIQPADQAVLETRVVEEPVTVIMSQKGWLRARQGHSHDATQFSFKAGDAYYDAVECLTTHDLIAIGDTGRVYTVPVADLPSARGDGQPVTAMVDVETESQIVHMIVGPASQSWVLATQSGYGFISQLSDMTSRQRAGKQFISVDTNDDLLKPVAIPEDGKYLAVLSKQQRLLIFPLTELRTLSDGGKGSRLMDLDADDGIAQWTVIGEQGLQVSGVFRRKTRQDLLTLDTLSPYMGKRARRGRKFTTRLRDFKLSAPVIEES